VQAIAISVLLTQIDTFAPRIGRRVRKLRRIRERPSVRPISPETKQMSDREPLQFRDVKLSEQFFRSIFENAQIGISFFRIDGKAVFTNRAFQEMLGYTEHELSHLERWDEIIHPDERASGTKRYAELIQGKREKDEWEQRFIHRDGSIVIANARFSVLTDAAGKPEYVASLTEDITDSKRAEEERNRVMQQMEMLLESIGQGIYGIDLQGNCTFINRATCKMIGYQPAEALGQNMHGLVHHHKADGSPYPVDQCPIYRAFKVGIGCRVDAEVMWRRDGTSLPVEYSSFPIFEDGRITGAVVTILDITERKAADRELQSILDNSSAVIQVKDLSGRYLRINRRFEQIFGLDRSQVLGKTDHELFPKETADRFRANDLEVLRTARALQFEETAPQLDGPHDYLSIKFPLHDGAGVVYATSGIFTDITDRKRAEEKLTESEQLFRSIFENAQIGIGVFKIDRQELSPNRALQEMLGYSEKELSRLETWDKITHPDESASDAKRYAELVEGARDKDEWEQRLVRRDGRIVVTSVRFSLLRDTAGRPQYVASLQEDITERKRLEGELVTAKEVAEAATKAKSDFLANMSHEIRTPMNAILGMTHLALKTELTLKQRDYLTKTKVAAQALLGIINDILDFSKIEAGKLDMEKTEFRLDSVLENLSSVVSQKAHDKNLEFLIAASHDLPPNLIGDALRLGQILINLVNNAVKFTEHGEVVVTVAVEERDSDRVKLKFSVRDSGIGMTPGQTARLFQAFSQADTSTTRKYGGTGLGLSISKRLVEMMGGEIGAESNFGAGSTFQFIAWFGTPLGETRRKRFIPDLENMRVLVVDDNEQARLILSDALRGFGLRAESASSGEEAIQKVTSADSEDPYRVLMMDWQMPGMDGLEASHIIMRGNLLKQVPKIVMVTAFGREDIQTQAEAMGIDGYLLKPVSPSLLYDTLVDLFGVSEQEGGRSRPLNADGLSPNANGIRILLVEDNEVNQQVATELLESAGASVRIANHGGEAVKILTESEGPPPFDVVFMDLQMPEMDGFTATRLIRAQAHLQNLPIIAMTAHALVEERRRCLEAGMNDHVSKPIDPDALFATLMRWTKPVREHTAQTEAGSVKAIEEMILPELDGVDVAGGLRRVAGNRRLYRDLLAQFASTQCDAGSQISAAIESGTRELAERIAHTVKGVAGNIGVGEVFKAAEKLERAIRDRGAIVPVLLEEFTQLLGGQVQTIRRALRDSPTHEPSGERDATTFDPQAASAALARLKVLLESSDGDAAEAFIAVENALVGAVEKEQLNALGKAVNDFDFATALLKLVEVEEKYGADRKHGDD
jgi:two-component system, sensor histidine kinase and response regulator